MEINLIRDICCDFLREWEVLVFEIQLYLAADRPFRVGDFGGYSNSQPHIGMWG